MASSNHIPPLSTLLAARRGGGAPRDRARGRDSAHVSDDAVQGTDRDAAGSRLSCVELGYLHDPYANLLATQSATRRLPLLNRGTYLRTSAIDLLIAHFLQTYPSSAKQVVSLGAGTDTRYFRLLDLYPQSRLIYHEIDFPANSAAKIAAIQKYPLLYRKLHTPPTSSSTCYHSDTYNVHAFDLRSLVAGTETLPDIPNLNPLIPTLFLSEMCLVYLQPATVQSIISSLLTHYLQPATAASLALYEPLLPQDAFGRTMIANLKTRNIHLPTLAAYPELGDQRARLQGYGLAAGARAVDTSWIWRDWVPSEEKERVAGLEFLDELEELELLLKHYCVAWGWRDGESDVFSKAWADVREQAG